MSNAKFVSGQLVHLVGCLNGEGYDNVILQIGYCDIDTLQPKDETVPPNVISEFNRKFETLVGKTFLSFTSSQSNPEVVFRKVLDVIDSMNEERGLPRLGKSFRFPELKHQIQLQK